MADGQSWYVNTCADCVYMDLKERCKYDNSRAWCSERRDYYPPTDRACSSRFKYDEARTSSSGCYLTTITHEILGYADTCDTLQTMRLFRDEVLMKDEKYQNLLLEYDVVGPVLADAIRKSRKPKEISRFLFDTYIEPTKNCIQMGKFELAVFIYTYMVEELKKFCGIKTVAFDSTMEPTGKGYIKGSGFQHQR